MTRTLSNHNATLRAFLDAAAERANAELMLKKFYGYTDDQLRLMVASNQKGVENFGARKVVPAYGRGRTVPEVMSPFSHAVIRARKIQAARLFKRCHVSVPDVQA